MKTLIRTKAVIAALVLLLFVNGCGRYTSSYQAVGLVHTSTSASAEMRFLSFSGRKVFKLKSSGEGDLKYSARMESGKATVRYDYYGTADELFSVSGGEEIDAHGGYVEAGTVYIIDVYPQMTAVREDGLTDSDPDP